MNKQAKGKKSNEKKRKQKEKKEEKEANLTKYWQIEKQKQIQKNKQIKIMKFRFSYFFLVVIKEKQGKSEENTNRIDRKRKGEMTSKKV